MTSTNTYTHCNHYLTLVCNIALKNKYTRWYFNIISRALERPRNRTDAKAILGYVEGHHILPISFNMGGSKDPENIVFLTSREHFVVHTLMTKMYKGTYQYKMIKALICFKDIPTYRARYINSRLYEHNKKILVEGNWYVSNETRKKLSLVHKGKKRAPKSEETKRKISLSNLGKTFSAEARKRMSESAKGRRNAPQAIQKLKDTVRDKWANATPITCPFCNNTFKCKTRFTRFHVINCKTKSPSYNKVK